MKKFLINLLFFSIPLLLWAVPPLIPFISSEENLGSLDATIQKNEKYLIGYAYSEKNKYIKWKHLVSNEGYEIVALGSSRVLPFRSLMFSRSFYNAGQTATNMGSFIPFLQSIPQDKLPKYLIVNIDQWWFNENWNKVQPKSGLEYWTQSSQKTPDFNTLQNIWKDLISNKIKFILPEHKFPVNLVGLNAIVKNTGVRNDGSFFYGDQIKKLLASDKSAKDFLFQETFERIDRGVWGRGFEYGDLIDTNCLVEMDSFLNYCNSKNIIVIGFLPPYADKVIEKMNASKKYRYQESIYLNSKDIFNKYQFELYDFTVLASCDANDEEMIDGTHAGELTYAKMLIKMLESNSRLNEVSNIEKLRNEVSKAINSFTVYEE